MSLAEMAHALEKMLKELGAERDTLAREAVEGRRAEEAIALSGNHVRSLIIGHEHENIEATIWGRSTEPICQRRGGK